MIHKPRFRSHFRVEVAADEVALVHETGAVRLESPLPRKLAPLLDGRRTAEEIARELAGELSPLDVAFGLSWLEEQGWIVEAGEESPLDGIIDALGLDPAEARRGLRERTVRIVQEIPAGFLVESLLAMGVRVDAASSGLALTPQPLSPRLPPDLTGERGSNSFPRQASPSSPVRKGGRPGEEGRGDEGQLSVVVTADYLRTDPGRSFTCLPVKPVGTHLWIGPLFDPAKRGCWRCLATRLRAWHPEAEVPQPTTDSTLRAGLALAATEILQWVLQGSNPALEGTLITFDVRTLETARHAVLPVPDCPACGVPVEPAAPHPLILSSHTKIYTPGGGDRAASPATMLRRYSHLISPLTGIVDRLVPSLDQDLLQIYTAGYVSPAGEKQRSAGRGVTAEQARAAALCEALERHSGFFRGTEPRVQASFRDLGTAAVHPNDCLRISERQYAGRDAWNRLDLPYHWLSMPFDEERPVAWTPAWSLTHGDHRWLPAAYCFYGAPLPENHRFCRADSNGCAAGSCLEEAIVQGFCEIVERDALALWWYNRARRPAVRLDSFRNPYFTALAGHLELLGRRVWVLDLTTDLGIPAFAALSREIPPRPGDLILGAGCHLDPAVAIAKALTEITQFLPGFLAGRPRRVLSDDPGEAPWLEPDPDRPPLAADDLPCLARPDLREEVELCVERARGRGLEVLVVDQTREEIGLPVVRVVVPGMRLFRARFAPGRLYDVPVALGWIPAPLGEEDLNPVHILI
ncbi:MAG TPA: TOMM precursor leader peptide-binding protein [Thermoanaerobaculia bacterium]